MSTALLVAEPEPSLVRHLTSDGFRLVEDGTHPDLVLVGTAAAVDEYRHRHGNVPVIVLGEPDSDSVDCVRALERGCDDFVPRPFDYEELLARIRAVLRRTAPPKHDVLRAGPIAVDRTTRRVTVDGRPAPLAGKEYELLLRLMVDPERVFTKDELLRDVWDFRSIGRTRTLDSHASRLRRKLMGNGDDRFVVNVWGVGYRLLDG
jgi:DNA-binding response OmpR family regulator